MTRKFAVARRVVVLLAVVLLAAAPAARIGVEMPRAGDDGARGLAISTAIELALGRDRVLAQDSARGGFLNPHRDEGSDNAADVMNAPSIVASFAADPNVVAAIGGLRRNVGDADADVADRKGLPTIVLSRWSRSAAGAANTYCICASPPRFVAFARDAARAHFGPHLLVALVDRAAELPRMWPNRFGGVPFVVVAGSSDPLGGARYWAPKADAVLVIADERPAILWRSSTFRRRFDLDYLRRFVRRGYRLVPKGARRGDVLVLRELLSDGAERRAFERRFHAAAGFLPDDDAQRAFAAAQVLRAAGTSRVAIRKALRDRLFSTIAGPVAFDADGYRATVDLRASPP